MKSIILAVILSFFSFYSQSQNLEYRSVDYYFDIVEKAESEQLKKEGIINDKFEILEKYKDSKTGKLNKVGFEKYSDIKVKVLQSIFKDYLYQQDIEYKDDVYVLYFSMAGFDDTEWQILKWKKTDWDKSYKIDLRLVEDCKSKSRSNKTSKQCNFIPIAFNYDEGPKNLENIRIFIKNDHLVMERGNLYHTLYDLKNNKLIVNDESPWSSSGAKGKEEMNLWITENIHNKINNVINP